MANLNLAALNMFREAAKAAVENAAAEIPSFGSTGFVQV